jgi:hypothetical protein
MRSDRTKKREQLFVSAAVVVGGVALAALNALATLG